MTWMRTPTLLVSLLILSGCCIPGAPPGLAAPHPVQPPISDHAIRARIHRAMQEMYEAETYPRFHAILPQLERSTCRLSPRVTESVGSGPVDPTWKIYGQALDQVLIVSRWYQCDRCDKWHESHAGGFAITPDGAIVTSYHVVENDDAEFMVAVTRAGKVYPIREILAADQHHDVAILQVDTGEDSLVPVTLAASAPVGSQAIVISHPDGRFYTLTHGVVSRYVQQRRSRQTTTWMDITADFARGSSGSPIFDEFGRVIGLVSRTHSIFYESQDDKAPSDLQMVLKICTPAQAILDLIETPERQ